ncbi:MAG: VOC family protein [Chloracidobacterium sp.]|nr:VOC family protein [Chloracidobacterium sp.]
MAKLVSAFGYQGDAMNLPVASVEASVLYYESKMGFGVVERETEPINKVLFERDTVRFGIAENGGDPEQDGCAFHIDDAEALRSEFIANGLENIGQIKNETREDGSRFKVFFVIAPDGLCYWFGERI